jgi:hypothetical protein
MTPIDDNVLDALLAAAPEELADDGFTAAVMRRVQADIALRHHTLDANVALARLRQAAVRSRHVAHWRWIGAAAGVVVAVLPVVAVGSAAVAFAPASLAALMAALGAVTWLISESVAREA